MKNTPYMVEGQDLEVGHDRDSPNIIWKWVPPERRKRGRPPRSCRKDVEQASYILIQIESPVVDRLWLSVDILVTFETSDIGRISPNSGLGVGEYAGSGEAL
ncbi:hypothetical protein HUJ04_001519 [Dendroctonus ponderosae]|nr:hypothetical protein HUJ04_001519 [Dendroctonus ponderosae]